MKEQIPSLRPKTVLTDAHAHFLIFHPTMKENSVYELHSHEFFEIEIIVSGRARSNINGRECEIGPGSVLFFTPADFHDIRVIGDGPLSNYNIAFATDMIRSHVWSEIPMSCQVVQMDERTLTGIVSICERMVEEFKYHKATAENILRTGIEWILLMIGGALQSEESYVPQTDAGIAAVLAYVFDNFTREISRDQAAERMHVSPMYFSKYFHAKMGISFQNYVLDLRLDYARRLLTAVDAPIADVASASGFHSVGYFTRAFTRKYGISPRKYAQQQAGTEAIE